MLDETLVGEVGIHWGIPDIISDKTWYPLGDTDTVLAGTGAPIDTDVTFSGGATGAHLGAAGTFSEDINVCLGEVCPLLWLSKLLNTGDLRMALVFSEKLVVTLSVFETLSIEVKSRLGLVMAFTDEKELCGGLTGDHRGLPREFPEEAELLWKEEEVNLGLLGTCFL